LGLPVGGPQDSPFPIRGGVLRIELWSKLDRLPRFHIAFEVEPAGNNSILPQSAIADELSSAVGKQADVKVVANNCIRITRHKFMHDHDPGVGEFADDIGKRIADIGYQMADMPKQNQ
jgi:hypothetical protein